MNDPREVGVVSTEGGPLLIADRAGIAAWRGIDGDYQALVDALDAGALTVPIDDGRVRALAWPVPTGSYEAWRLAPGEVLLVAASDELDRVETLPDAGPTGIGGRVTVASGWLVVLWAAQAAAPLAEVTPVDGLAPDLDVGGAVLFLEMPAGTYELVVASRDRACLIRPEGSRSAGEVRLRRDDRPPTRPTRPDPLRPDPLRPDPLRPDPLPEVEEPASVEPVAGQLEMWDA